MQRIRQDVFEWSAVCKTVLERMRKNLPSVGSRWDPPITRDRPSNAVVVLA
ncbi:hypothetical protein ACFL5O_09875 [Myxococcota bacterium]